MHDMLTDLGTAIHRLPAPRSSARQRRILYYKVTDGMHNCVTCSFLYLIIKGHSSHETGRSFCTTGAPAGTMMLKGKPNIRILNGVAQYWPLERAYISGQGVLGKT